MRGCLCLVAAGRVEVILIAGSFVTPRIMSFSRNLFKRRAQPPDELFLQRVKSFLLNDSLERDYKPARSRYISASLLRIWRAELAVQIRFDRRPFRVREAIINRVAHAAAVGDHVIAQRAFLFCAETQNRGARARVERIGFKLEANAAERFESVLQHEILRFGVHDRALPRFAHPRPTNLNATMRYVDIAEARAAHDAARAFLRRRKRQRGSCFLLAQRGCNIVAHMLRRFDRHRGPAPQLFLEADLAQWRVMVKRQRHHANMMAGERNRRDAHRRTRRYKAQGLIFFFIHAEARWPVLSLKRIFVMFIATVLRYDLPEDLPNDFSQENLCASQEVRSCLYGT